MKPHTGSPRNQRPYLGRSAQWRLFVLVAALMTVLVAMSEVRKPTAWSWLWKGAPRDPSDPVDTRITSDPPNTKSDQAVVIAKPSVASPANNPSNSAAERYWQRIWDSLEPREKVQLSRILRAARLKRQVTADDTILWKPLVVRLDESWDKLVSPPDVNIANADPTLDRPETTSNSELERLHAEWDSKTRPALESAANADEWSEDIRLTLAALASITDQLALNDIRDDTVWRADDSPAWFRLIEKLQRTPPAKFVSGSIGHVTHVQIFRQSEEYRGQIVTVRGTARLVYRVPAPPNDLDVKDYCLFWIQPEDGSNRPIVLYSLEAPPNFPEITSEQKKVRESIEVTGYFFKRWVYRAADGLNSAPLLIAKAPVWQPPTPAPLTATDKLADSLGPLFWPVMLSAAAVLGAIAVGIAWLANWSSRPRINLRRAAQGTDDDVQPTWDTLPATYSVQESLNKLEQSESAMQKENTASRQDDA